MKIYNEERTTEEIISIVNSYVESIKNNKYDRYHDTLSLLPEGSGYVLDYGCGWGHYSIGMRQKGYEVLGIDVSQNEIDICNLVWGNIDGVKFRYNKIESLRNEMFDFVISSQVIEHVHNPGNYLSQVNRVLKVKGKLIISLPNISNPRFIGYLLSKNIESKLIDFSQSVLNKYDKAHDHIQAWDPFHFTALCSSLGFQVERFLPMEGVPLPFSIFSHSYLYLKNKRLRNLSYTMVFLLEKKANIEINNND